MSKVPQESVPHGSHQKTEELRAWLLYAVAVFVDRARQCPGVLRIALLGSLTTCKRTPKDADVLVTVADAADLEPLARAGRQLKGVAQSRNAGADIFLASPAGGYLGRICHWRRCQPFVRAGCMARHCGRRPYLNDDLDVIALASERVTAPPIELWPTVIRRVKVPNDVETRLLGGQGGP